MASTDKQKAARDQPSVFVLSPDPTFPQLVNDTIGDLCGAVFVSQPRLLPSQAVGPAPALVLIDDGFERPLLDVASDLAHRWPSLRIIVLTGDTSAAGRTALARLAMVLFKPVSAERLRDAVLLRLRMAAMSARVEALRAFNRPDEASGPPTPPAPGSDAERRRAEDRAATPNLAQKK